MGSGGSARVRDQRIRVMVCDDHAVLRAGLRALLSAEPDIEVVAEASSGEKAVQGALQWSPDVVLMDITLPGIDGLEATRQIRKRLPNCRVLILTMHQQIHYLLAALQAGAAGYVLKSDLDQELVRAIRTASQGEAFIYSSDTRALFQAYLEGGGRIEGAPPLSPMETRVLTLTAQGLTAQEIGQHLNISPSTVDTYRSRIMNKLGLGRRSELIRWALQHGLLADHQ